MTVQTTLAFLAASLVLVPASCGSSTNAPTVPESPDSAYLLELTLERQDGRLATGLRVHGDGTLEFLTEDGWRAKWTYETDELDELRRAIADADSPPLEERYSRATETSHPMTAHWRLRSDDGVKEVTIAAYEPGIVPALDTLYRRVFELHREPPSDSIWRIRVGDQTIERVVGCEPASVPALRPLVRALFLDKSGRPGVRSIDGSKDPLVEVVWRTEGDVTERTLVYPDGRSVSVRGQDEQEEQSYSVDELAAIRAAINRIDWRALPDPVC
jgi:hypothetical protein